MTTTELLEGPELDRLVFEKLFKRKVLGKGMCVPIGPVADATVYPLLWEVVGGPGDPVKKKSVLRDVYVHVCVCKEPAYGKSVADAFKLYGHPLMCLRAIPSFSSVDAVALDMLEHCFKEWGVERKEEGFGVTIYKPGAYAEGPTFAVAVCRAAVKARK